MDLRYLGLHKPIHELDLNELKRAYRRRALQWHPDRGGDPVKFKRLNDAYLRVKGKIIDRDHARGHDELKSESLSGQPEPSAAIPRTLAYANGKFNVNRFNNVFDDHYVRDKGYTENDFRENTVDLPPSSVSSVHHLNQAYADHLKHKHTHYANHYQVQKWRPQDEYGHRDDGAMSHVLGREQTEYTKTLADKNLTYTDYLLAHTVYNTPCPPPSESQSSPNYPSHPSHPSNPSNPSHLPSHPSHPSHLSQSLSTFEQERENTTMHVDQAAGLMTYKKEEEEAQRRYHQRWKNELDLAAHRRRQLNAVLR